MREVHGQTPKTFMGLQRSFNMINGFGQSRNVNLCLRKK